MQADRAAAAFGMKRRNFRHFCEPDQFNPANVLEGYVCTAFGAGAGCLYIYSINGLPLATPVVVHGEPRQSEAFYQLAEDEEPVLDIFPKVQAHVTDFALAESWHGLRCTAFAYPVTGAPGGSITCVSFAVGRGPLCSVETKRAILKSLRLSMGRKSLTIAADLPSELRLLRSREITSLLFVLCGHQAPRQVVKYEHSCSLKLLLLRGFKGQLRAPPQTALVPFDAGALQAACMAATKQDLQLNRDFRTQNSLPWKYEPEHFATAGRILYLTAQDGCLADNTAFFLTPPDYLDARDAAFGAGLQENLKAAVKAHDRRASESMEEYVRRISNFGQGAWYRYRKRLVKYAEMLLSPSVLHQPRLDRPFTGSGPILLVLVGIPGCGKSRLSEALGENDLWLRVSQDELKTSGKCQEVAEVALKRYVIHSVGTLWAGIAMAAFACLARGDPAETFQVAVFSPSLASHS